MQDRFQVEMSDTLQLVGELPNVQATRNFSTNVRYASAYRSSYIMLKLLGIAQPNVRYALACRSSYITLKLLETAQPNVRYALACRSSYIMLKLPESLNQMSDML